MVRWFGEHEGGVGGDLRFLMSDPGLSPLSFHPPTRRGRSPSAEDDVLK